MRDGIGALTAREKEALRLLVAGHDAKSSARALGLSVHTVNERLRDARRKLDVSSSREAARRLAEAERDDPKSLGDRFLGVPEDGGGVAVSRQQGRPHRAGNRLAWFGGGMVIMSLIIGAIALSLAFDGGVPPGAQAYPPAPPAPPAAPAAPAPPAGQAAPAPPAPPAPLAAPAALQAASMGAAREWIGLIDRHNWEESWRTAAGLFKGQITAPQWASTMQNVRQPLGKVSSRTFQSVTRTRSLPGVPEGDYEVLQFGTDFAGKSGAIETVILVREESGWKVAGYFVR